MGSNDLADETRSWWAPSVFSSDIPLPDGLRWFRVEDQIAFPVYGPSGGLRWLGMCVIISIPPIMGFELGRHGRHSEGGGLWYVLEFDACIRREAFDVLLNEALASLREVL